MKNKLIESIPISLFLLFILISTACNIDFPTPKNMMSKPSLITEVNAFIQQNPLYFSEHYSINPNVNWDYEDGVKTETHSLEFGCYNDNLPDLETPKLDSLSKILAKTILSNIENDTSFNQVRVTMTKQEKSGITEKEWNYVKAFEIKELKN